MEYGSALCAGAAPKTQVSPFATHNAGFGQDNRKNYVGWVQSVSPASYRDLFKAPTLRYIKQTCANYLETLFGQPYVVPDEEILGMIQSVWNAEKGGNRSDIYTEDVFRLPQNEPYADYRRIVEITIEAIVRQIRNSVEMQECNYKLDIWSQLYGTGNKFGLQAYSLPKKAIRRKRPTPMLFNMNY